MNQFLYDLLLSGADKWNQYRSNHPEVGMDPTKEEIETQEGWLQRVRTIIEIDLAEANIQDLTLADYNLYRADFCNANCRNVRFDQCDLNGADFKGAQLAGCQFRSCALLMTSFDGAELCGVCITDCDGVLAIGPQTSFIEAEVLDSRLRYLCIKQVQAGASPAEFTITEMMLREGNLAPLEGGVNIAEVRRLQ